MNPRLLCCAVLAFLICRAPGEQPAETVARGYIEAMRSGDMEHVATYMHPAALEKFKDILTKVAEVIIAANAAADPKTNQAVQVLFGAAGPHAVKEADPKELFVGFMGNITKVVPMMREMLAGSTYDFIGHVEEGGNLSHVVYRATLKTATAEVTKMEVLTLKRDGEQWKVMLTGDLESLVGGIGRQFQRK